MRSPSQWSGGSSERTTKGGSAAGWLGVAPTFDGSAAARRAASPATAIEGARTTAAMTASRYGPVLKVSEDGLISFYDNDKIWDI